MPKLDLGVLTSLLVMSAKLLIALDPPGNIGPIATLLAKYDTKKQRKIIAREALIALSIMLVFYFGGAYFLDALHLSQATVKTTGGIVFGFIGISILFGGPQEEDIQTQESEPLIVPIAIPLIAGPACLAILVSEFSESSVNVFMAVAAIILAWAITSFILQMAPYLVARVGDSGLKLVEQIIGLICVIVAVQTILEGLEMFFAQ